MDKVNVGDLQPGQGYLLTLSRDSSSEDDLLLAVAETSPQPSNILHGSERLYRGFRISTLNASAETLHPFSVLDSAPAALHNSGLGDQIYIYPDIQHEENRNKDGFPPRVQFEGMLSKLVSVLPVREAKFSDFVAEEIRNYMPPAHAAEVLRESKAFIISSIVAGGKGTITKILINKGFAKDPKSYTTRSPKPRDRINGENAESIPIAYHFVDAPDIVGKMAASEMIEVALVHKDVYGTSLEEVKLAHARGLRPVLEIDIQGMQKIKSVAPNVPGFFIVPGSNLETWLPRWAKRDKEDITREDFNARVESALFECETALRMYLDGQLMLIDNTQADTAAESIMAYLDHDVLANQDSRYHALRNLYDEIKEESISGNLWNLYNQHRS